MHMVRLARDVGPPAREQELRDFPRPLSLHGEMAQQAVGSLRVAKRRGWCWPCWSGSGPNLLLLDEPTNHLDLTTREALSIALNEFEGTVMLVSHDRALLRETCDEFWLVARGQVQPFDGDLDDYQRWLLEVSRASARGQPLPDPPRAQPAVVEEPAQPNKAQSTRPAASRSDKNDRNDRKQGAQARQQAANRTRPLRLKCSRSTNASRA
jgi:ATP-binding cassette subfamily F protein 3